MKKKKNTWVGVLTFFFSQTLWFNINQSDKSNVQICSFALHSLLAVFNVNLEQDVIPNLSSIAISTKQTEN